MHTMITRCCSIQTKVNQTNYSHRYNWNITKMTWNLIKTWHN